MSMFNLNFKKYSAKFFETTDLIMMVEIKIDMNSDFCLFYKIERITKTIK